MPVEPIRRAKHNVEKGKMLCALTTSPTYFINHGCTTCIHEFYLESGACFYVDAQYLAYPVGMTKFRHLALSRSISRLATWSFQSIRVWLSIYVTRSLLILLPVKVGNGQSLVSTLNNLVLMA
jgi:hypothetical protein